MPPRSFPGRFGAQVRTARPKHLGKAWITLAMGYPFVSSCRIGVPQAHQGGPSSSGGLHLRLAAIPISGSSSSASLADGRRGSGTIGLPRSAGIMPRSEAGRLRRKFGSRDLRRRSAAPTCGLSSRTRRAAASKSCWLKRWTANRATRRTWPDSRNGWSMWLRAARRPYRIGARGRAQEARFLPTLEIFVEAPPSRRTTRRFDPRHRQAPPRLARRAIAAPRDGMKAVGCNAGSERLT